MRTQGGARRERADPGLWGATALRLAGGEDRRGAGLMKHYFLRALHCCALCGVGELFVGGLAF